MDINNLLCNDDNNRKDNDVEMKDSNVSNDTLPMLPELKSPPSNYESTNPILYSSMATTSNSSNAMVTMTNEDMPNMKSLTINSPTSTPTTPPTPSNNIMPSKLDSLSGIAAATAALKQRKHVRNSPRARKSALSISNGSGSPSGNHYPYTTTVGSSRHRLLAPVTPQPPPNHPISSAILRRNRLHNGIKNVVRGVFTHNQQSSTNTSNNDASSSSCNYAPHNIFAHIHNNFNNINNNNNRNNSNDSNNNNNNNSNNNSNNMNSSSSPNPNNSTPLMSETPLNQDDVNHGIKCCLQWLKYAITHLDQEINLLRNIANESFHMYCNNIQNRNRDDVASTSDNNNNNNGNSSSDPNYYDSTSTNYLSNDSNNSNSLLPPFQMRSHQLCNFHRKSLIEIKREIVFTIKRTVEVIIKGASKYLPGESRLIIRRFILSLPSRLSKLTEKVKPESITSTAANANGNGKIMDSDASVSSSPMSSMITDPLNDNVSISSKVSKEEDNSINSMNATKEESLKIMTLATEGNDMLKKMMDVFEKSFQENNKNNLNNINLINTNEASSLNYNTNKMLYNPINQNNDKFNKINNNVTTATTNSLNTTINPNNTNYTINNSVKYEESINTQQNNIN